ncbi:flavodoxin domain-containing protein [Natroniella acetigena]|uniref:flavodoxin domain-containing protein n=1 Tax=Natroniella acetigena TaxID=52004 RepID=UPI00200A3DEC|nr:flavodoxin domain-containing protein [Natroniella acetigena]MCK8827664.1 flavodoxin domain-containing protein [Natroniella acetigena]
MKKLVVYSTKYSATEKAAKKLAGYLGEEIKVVNLATGNVEDLNDYDLIVIGGSIYAGKIQKEVKNFCEGNMNQLMDKKLGLFICCGYEEKADEQLSSCFEQKLLEQAEVKGYFGYEYNFEKMNFIFKMIIKKLAKVDKTTSKIKEENIKQFANELLGAIDDE